MILLDTSGLLANYDLSSPQREAAERAMSNDERLILSPFVLAELDYLVTEHLGQAAEFTMLDDVASGAFELVSFDVSEVGIARSIIERYADLRLGLTDASIIVLAERYECYDILTLDQRHFRAVLGPRGRPFRLLPFDTD